ncbi:MAG TPA: molybdopterin cofactor-binding domain-containing protein, partial [Candidatus Angelobacter sp.]|nr:molybdopterin cofactor-binding domain-containing protein [Candidatus Angelobacter sp.]
MDENTKYGWPAPEQRSLIGKRISRVDGPEKASGRAKYTYDVHRPGMLYGKVVRCPHAHAKVTSVDISAAEKMPGVKGVFIIQDKGSEIHWAGDDVVVVAAVDEPIAADAARTVKVEYEVLPHFVDDFSEPKNIPESTGPLTQRDLFQMFNAEMPDEQVIATVKKRGITFKVSPEMAQRMKENEVSDAVIQTLQAAAVKEPQPDDSPYKKETEQIKGDPDAAFKETEVISEGVYGCPVITHCCLESHGSIAEWTDNDHLFSHISTQNVSGLAGQYSQALKIPAANVHVHQD